MKYIVQFKHPTMCYKLCDFNQKREQNSIQYKTILLLKSQQQPNRYEHHHIRQNLILLISESSSVRPEKLQMISSGFPGIPRQYSRCKNEKHVWNKNADIPFPYSRKQDDSDQDGDQVVNRRDIKAYTNMVYDTILPSALFTGITGIPDRLLFSSLRQQSSY